MGKKWNIDIIVIVCLGLLVRLLLLPHADVVHADAISRINHAYDWIRDPHYIVSGVWGPMNNYAFGLSMKLFGGKIAGPQLFNILLAVFTTYPLYWFTKSLFNSRNGAIAASTIYILTPIVIRNSFQALPSVPFTFFLILAIYYTAEYLRNKNEWYILFAGLAINVASGFRYEAWIISLLMGVILILNKEYKQFIRFGIIAAIFPISWMIGGWIEHGDFLYSLSYSSEWGANEAAVVDGFGKIETLNRALFFPFSLLIVLNPFVLGFLIYGIIAGLRKKRFTKNQLLWLSIPLVLLLIYSYKLVTGTMLLQHKYIVSIIAMLIPFVALIFAHHSKRIKVIFIIGATLTIPFSSGMNNVDWKDKLSFAESFSDVVQDLFVLTFHETEALPKLEDETFGLFVDAYHGAHQENEGLIIDNLGWENTYFLAMHSQSKPFITDVTLQSDPSPLALSNYIKSNPNGLLMYNYLGRLYPLFDNYGNQVKLKNTELVLTLTEVRNSQGLILFRYELEQEALVLKGVGSVLDYEEDIDYFIRKIKSDKYWLHSIKRQAHDKGISLEQAIFDNAQYVISTQ